VNELIETITVNVANWTMCLEGLLLHSLEFLLHFACAIMFNGLPSEPESTVPVLSSAGTKGAADTACQSIGMGC